MLMGYHVGELLVELWLPNWKIGSPWLLGVPSILRLTEKHKIGCNINHQNHGLYQYLKNINKNMDIIE